MRISDWSSDVCSSDLFADDPRTHQPRQHAAEHHQDGGSHEEVDERAHGSEEVPDRLHIQGDGFAGDRLVLGDPHEDGRGIGRHGRSEEHTSELQSLMRNSYAVFCLKKKNKKKENTDDENYKTSINSHMYTIVYTIHTT